MGRYDDTVRLRLSRRTLLRAAAALGAGAAASPYLVRGVRAQELAPAELEVWHQDFGPLNEFMGWIKAAVEAEQPNVTVSLMPLSFEELDAQFLPSIAAGTEGDIMLAYAFWLAAIDMSKPFLPVVPDLLTREEAESRFYPAALAEVSVGDAVFGAPQGNGGGGSVWTYNAAILEQEGINPATIVTWDDFVDVGKALTTRDGDDITRSGIAVSDGIAIIALSWLSGLASLGGQPFDAEAGTFHLTTPESIEALKRVDDLLKVHKVDDWAKQNGAPEAFEQGLSVFSNVGSWMLGGFAETSPDFRGGLLPNPLMGDKSDALFSAGGASFVISGRLAGDEAKKAAALLFLREMTEPSVVGEFVDINSAGIAFRQVASDPAVQAERTFGYIQKQYDELVWPRLVAIPTHVPDWHGTVAYAQLERVFKDSEPYETVLADLESESNRLEADARERLSL